MPKTFHPDEQALLAAIHAAPRDDVPRLVYADWLDEHGQHDLAEMIRLAIEAALTRTRPESVPRICELDRSLRRRYVSPVPDKMRCCGWPHGLPWLVSQVHLTDASYRRILDGCVTGRSTLYTFGLALHYTTLDGLAGMLDHPVMAQVHSFGVVAPPRICADDIRLLAESPRLRLLRVSFLDRPVRPEVSDAIMSFLAPMTTAGWWEIGKNTAIDSDVPSTWPDRFARQGTLP